MAGGEMKRSVGDMAAAEATRVARILKRDRKEAEANLRRQEALARVVSGDPTSLIDTAVPPTPEWLAKVENRRVMGSLDDWTDQRVPTYRRVTEVRIVQLHNRGVIDDDLFAACRWYRSAWERSGLDAGAAIAAYDGDPKGEKIFGQMPRTQAQAEARADFRYAQCGIPGDVLPLFDRVVLVEDTLADAAKATRSRYANAQAAFRRAALALHGRIAHLLPIR